MQKPRAAGGCFNVFMMQIKLCGLLACLFLSAKACAQELYVFSDPASNVPARSVVAKAFTQLGNANPLRQRYGAEAMAGLSKKWMLRGGTSLSNMMQRNVKWEAAYLYGKYRFLSNDDVHAHFRMAAFGEVGYSRNRSFFDEINIQGDVSGLQAGIIATQLKNKTAVSATVAFAEAFRKKELVGSPYFRTSKAVAYSLSAGSLVLPRVYKNYDQLNLNVYTELLGQKALDSEAWFVDLAPAVQAIFKSNTKLNFGYRFQLGGNAWRFNNQVYVIALEHTFFNALQKR
jgi:hypothetical protein